MSHLAKNPTVITAEPGRQEVVITREFEAPVELLFRAYTERDMVARWLGPRDDKLAIEVFDAYSGGSWRYISYDPQGNGFAFHGVFHEVLANQRIIQTFEFEGLPESGHVMLETARFEALPGNRCRLVTQSLFQSIEDRDGMVQSGMERGVLDSHARLDQLFASLV
ncbi:MAG: SRPBCC family protein [bacterium]